MLHSYFETVCRFLFLKALPGVDSNKREAKWVWNQEFIQLIKIQQQMAKMPQQAISLYERFVGGVNSPSSLSSLSSECFRFLVSTPRIFWNFWSLGGLQILKSESFTKKKWRYFVEFLKTKNSSYKISLVFSLQNISLVQRRWTLKQFF